MNLVIIDITEITEFQGEVKVCAAFDWKIGENSG
jgi:hypothetical protein